MSISSETSRRLDDAQAQISRLRHEVESLMKDRVTPAMSQFAGHAQDAYSSARGVVRDQSEMVSGRVQERPLIALAIAAAIGWAVGRIMR
jgi:ElaB/YqjD/DUF883 family membrane-anchored ribosome-binding protein